MAKIFKCKDIPYYITGCPVSSKAEREWRQKIDEVYKFLNL